MKALITGASSGIGREIAYLLANKGYDLIIVARREQELLKLKEEVKTNVRVISLDLSILDNIYKLYEMTKDEKIDVLINNAGFGLYGKFEEIDSKEELDLINLNIIAVHLLTKLFLKDMKERNNGYILNVASVASFAFGPLMASYYASKAYVLSLSMAINQELRSKKSKVSVSALCPGPVKTGFGKRLGFELGNKFSFMSTSASYVARKGIEGMLKRKPIIVVGFVNKILVFLTKIMPKTFITKVVHKYQKEKK
ncbi:MAG TPA: SDR family oxidoreductase [Tenericutes bacterium]|nr:SDR family oxidoreductase [Mycoplasmatota bacterium]